MRKHFNALALAVPPRAIEPAQPPTSRTPLASGASAPMDYDNFRNALAMAESGGDYGVTNTLGYMGRYQFGDERLADYTRATGVNPLADGHFSPQEQEAAFDWHISDIDRSIDALGASGFDRNGLRAVAHLGGIGGMRRFVRGDYNPSDAYGTSLSDYYQRFS